mgnify:FL=1|jgi:hypothetical protein
MSFQATIPSVGAVSISPEIISINQPITISVPVTEVLATLEYTWPYAGTVNSGQEVWPWP